MASVVLNDKTTQTTSTTTTADVTTDTGTSNDICRIVVDPDIKKQIVLDELSIDKVDSGYDDTEGTGASEKSNEKVAGREYPIIRINDYMIAPVNIKSMTISMTGRIPTISLDLKFAETKFRSVNMPKDGDIISVFFAPKTDTITSFRADFVITSAPMSYKKRLNVSLSGQLFIPGFDADSMFGYVGTTRDIFVETAKRYGLGFASDDLDETNDKQLWVCPNVTAEQFLDDTISHSWKDEMSFFDWWVDLYYNLNFINVNKIILQNTKEVDITAASNILAGSYDTPADYSQENTKAVPKMFTNISQVNNSAFYIKNWQVVNNSTSISLSDGVEIVSHEFLHNANINDDRNNTISKLSNVPAYDPNLVDDHILLRGRAEYDPTKNPTNEQARANYNYKDIYVKKPWCGISYVMSDGDSDSNETGDWSGNINKNYNRAQYHNRINLDELDKMYIKITVSGICSQVMRGEVVPVILKKDPTQDAVRNKKKEQKYGNADAFYCGYYYVSDMTFRFKKGSPMLFETDLTLKRREWPIPVDYTEDIEEEENTETNNE